MYYIRMDRVTRSRIRNWLNERDNYWVSYEEFEETFPEIELDLQGITMKEEDGEIMISKRDIYRALFSTRIK